MRVFYLRDARNHPVACIASEVENNEVKFAVSCWNPKDTFSKSEGRGIAIARLKNGMVAGTVPFSKEKGVVKRAIARTILARPVISRKQGQDVHPGPVTLSAVVEYLLQDGRLLD